MVHSSYIPVVSKKRCCWIDITSQVQKTVTESGIVAGMCTVTCLHTTAALTLNENADPDVGSDFFAKLAAMVPQESYFRHAEGNSDSHIKATLVGFHVQLAIADCRLVLGTWQSVYFCEFDGPRQRKCMVTVIGESNEPKHSGTRTIDTK